MTSIPSTSSMTSKEGKLQNMNLNTNKAGMEGLDTSKINEVITKASAGSKFYAHKQKRQDKLDLRIKCMHNELAKFTEQQVLQAECEMTKEGNKLEEFRDLSHTIVHIDMDMFYAAVEMRDDPTLRDIPMAVGSTGMLCTSNYAARKFGVRAAMPGFIGLKLCPSLKIVQPNFTKYKEVSNQVQEIFKEYDPNFSPMSLDEAYLDITNYIDLHTGDFSSDQLSVAEVIVTEIRSKIEAKTTLTASAGIAPNCLLAKVCSDLNKPNGQYFLPPDVETVMDFTNKLPIRKVSGIGGVTEQLLNSLGIRTCKDLYDKRGITKLLFSPTSSHYFLRVSLGLGSTEVEPSGSDDRKSISSETTFSATSDHQKLFEIIDDLCDDLSRDMIRRNIFGKTFTLKFKTSDFQLQTKAQTLLTPCQNSQIMRNTAHKLLKNELGNNISLRLLGVRMSDLCNGGSHRQVTLTDLFSKMENVTENDVLSEDSTDDPVSEDKEDNKEQQIEYTCPVCNNKTFNAIMELNTHIDLCLNRNLVQNLVKETHTTSVTKSCSVKRKREIPKNSPKKKITKNINTISKYLTR